MTIAAVIDSPNALTHAVPAKAVNSTKMHQPRSMRCPVFSLTGAAGGAAAWCLVCTAIAEKATAQRL
ncbi:hypothetical protein GCM10022200_11050 [Microbacterium awajiense]|uniref:Uncharacterized protein n=1 Tax=Microbacterium awajiense TaxID=415214 RepID=A0ABP7ADG1_9MICO